MQTLKIQSIRRDCGTQIRAGMTEDAVTEYAEAIRSGVTLPPVTVYRTPDGQHLLVDGFHRVEARSRCGFDAIAVEVIEGTERDAILHAVGANAQHGVRRSNEDKRRAVETLLRDPEWGQWSDREIAAKAGVSHPFVGRLRKTLGGNVTTDAERRYVTKHGSESVMDTTNIGASQGGLGGNVTTESGSRRVIGDAYAQDGPDVDDYCTDAAPPDDGAVYGADEGGVDVDPVVPCGGLPGGLWGDARVPTALGPTAERLRGLPLTKTSSAMIAYGAGGVVELLNDGGLTSGPQQVGEALAVLSERGGDGWWVLNLGHSQVPQPEPYELDRARAFLEAARMIGVTVHGVCGVTRRTGYLILDAEGRHAPICDDRPALAAAPATTQVQAPAPVETPRGASIDEVEEAAKLLRKALSRLRAAVGGDLPDQAARRLEARLSGIEETIAIADGTVAATRASAQASRRARARPGDSLSLQERDQDQDLERESRARPGAREAGRAYTHEADLVAGIDPATFAEVEGAWLAAATKPRGQLNDPARRELVAVLADYGVEKVTAAIRAIALEAHPNPNAAWIRDRIEGRGPAEKGGRRRQRKADPISTDQDQWAQVAEKTNAYGWQP